MYITNVRTVYKEVQTPNRRVKNSTEIYLSSRKKCLNYVSLIVVKGNIDHDKRNFCCYFKCGRNVCK